MPGEDELMDVRRMVAEAIADYDAAARDLHRWWSKMERDHPSLRRHKPADPEPKPAPEPKLDMKPDPMAPVRKLYDFLASTPPFNGWNLPDARAVTFKVIDPSEKLYCDSGGYHTVHAGQHVIAIHPLRIDQTDELIRTVAHEMIHLYRDHAGIGGGNTEDTWHDEWFQKMARRVCRAHGFDRLFGTPIAEIIDLPSWPRSKRHVA
jgi:hypothetical protein